ncbi:hypothetical protein SELMODRAFT_447787 [Selaginella moellendorffii]|uniref:Uncharacterized protein n=1 Tax=Selaginella moellendorffii TaxID=88036 RepID=D8T2A7_SELML|nr:hypothetical protein SELMODRAFT_447787 [Selaginella moellendorffii]
MCQIILIMGRQIRSKRQRRLSQVMDEFSITHDHDLEEDQAAVANNAAATNNALALDQAADLANNANDLAQQPQQPQQPQQHHHHRSAKSLWKIVKVPVLLLGSLFGLGEHYMSDYFDSMGTGDALRDARLRVWLRQDPSLADRHYMMVQSGMRYYRGSRSVAFGSVAFGFSSIDWIVDSTLKDSLPRLQQLFLPC